MKRVFRPSQNHGIMEVVNHIELVYEKKKKKKEPVFSSHKYREMKEMHLLKWGLWLKGALGYCLNGLTLEPALTVT